VVAGRSGALSIKLFERSCRAADAGLWGLDGGEERCEGGWDLRSGVPRAAWKVKSSWERQVCGKWTMVSSEERKWVVREHTEGWRVRRHPKHP